MSTEDTTEVTEGTPASATQEGASETTNPTEQATQEGQQTQETSEVSETTDEAVNEAETKQEEKAEESEKTTTEESSDAEYFFNGQQVQIEVPEDLKGDLDSAGVDVDTVLKELYGKDSDFTLSEETRKPLDDKFGKGIVDTFLGALKTQNESVLKGANDAQKAADEANRQAVEWSNEVVGGEENWTAMESWAADNLDDAQIESFNKAMNSGDKWLQELAIKDLSNKMRDSEGDTSANLISGDNSATETTGEALSAQAYIKEMSSKEFMQLKGADKQAAQKQLDARRRAGIKKGL